MGGGILPILPNCDETRVVSSQCGGWRGVWSVLGFPARKSCWPDIDISLGVMRRFCCCFFTV